MSCPLEPTEDRILVTPFDPEKRSRGGIIIPDGVSQDKPRVGVVIAKGPGRLLESGQLIPVPFAVGDRVLFGKYSGSDFQVDGMTVLVMHANDVLARINLSPQSEEYDDAKGVRIDPA